MPTVMLHATACHARSLTHCCAHPLCSSICQVIEKAAGERAQREIDERLQGAYAARARAKAAGQPFADTSVMQGRFPGGWWAVTGCWSDWLLPVGHCT